MPGSGGQRIQPSVAEPTLIHSVQRGLHLLERIAAHPEGISAKQLSAEAGLAPSTTYNLLWTLESDGYARRLANYRWILGARIDELHASRDQQRKP